MNVLVIGAGGVGTRFISLAYRLLDLTVMDGDKFEPKNLDRQLVSRKYIGKNKAEAMKGMYPDIHAIPEYLEFPEQLEGQEFAVAVPDNHMCRVVALNAADAYGFHLILAGNEEYTANAMYYHRKYRGTSVDPRVVYPDILAGAGREAGMACATRIVDKPQTGLANSMAADLALALTLYWTGDSPSEHLIKTHAPFEFKWDRSIMRTVRGYNNEDA